MSRKTKVLGFSLPPQTQRKLERLLKSESKTRSEFLRGLIEAYQKTVVQSTPLEKAYINDNDIASLLNAYWQTRSARSENIMVIGVGVVQREDGMILIGSRKLKDKWVKNLTWVFPGKQMHSLDFQKELEKGIYLETNLKVKVKNLITSRIHPDSGQKATQIILLYFRCSISKNVDPKPGGGLIELKWVRPMDVFKYFTTSTSDEMTRYLASIQR